MNSLPYSNPLVSVTVFAYNFEDYIGQCLQSIIEQKTDFPFEIIVGEDASSDSTASIVKDYAQRYPETVIPIFNKSNLGPKKNLIAVLELARGEYIAHMDGDDYMLPGKLQRQVDAFRANPSAAVVCHRVYRQYGERLLDNYPLPYPNQVVGLKELVIRGGGFFAHSSKMYTRFSMPPGGFRMYPCARALDTYLNVVCTTYGDIVVLDELLGVYRVINSGMNSPRLEDLWRNYYGNLRALSYARRSGVAEEAYLHGLAAVQLAFAYRYYAQGDMARFRKLVTKSYYTKPGIRLDQYTSFYLQRFPTLVRWARKWISRFREFRRRIERKR